MTANEALELWGRDTAANVQKVLWYLRELETPFVARGLGYEAPEPRDAAYLRVRTPVASPVLVEGDFVLWEANAILRYLADRSGGRFSSADAKVRADIDRWMDYQLSTIRGSLHTLLRDDLDVRAVARAAERLAASMEPVEAALATRPYLCGDEFTIGDIPVGITTYRWRILDVQRPPSPAIDAWLARLRARPAFAATVRPPIDTYVSMQRSPLRLGSD